MNISGIRKDPPGRSGRIDNIRVLVTGNKGYIGTVMVPMLITAGHEVEGLDSELYQRSVYGRMNRDMVNTRIKDIRDVKYQDVEGFDAVIHLAALSNDPLGDLDPELTMKINHIATVNLAKLAREAGAGKFIFSSSCSNYGAAGDGWVDENSTLNPVTPYGISKVKAEKDLMKLATGDFCVVLPRSATAYGFSPKVRFDLVVNNLTAWAYTTKKVHLKSDGTAWRPLVHIADISKSFTAFLGMKNEAINCKPVNIGSTEENYRIMEVAKMIHGRIEGTKLEFGEGAGKDLRNYRVNCDRLRKDLGVTTEWTVERGIEEIYEVIKKLGLTLEEFEGPRYKRVDHIRMRMDRGELENDLRTKLDQN